METSTTVKQMLAGNEIFVPNYQRAYSWNTDEKSPKQVNMFLSDLEDYNKSLTKSKYYFGHFLFEEKSENKFGIIDGQQRMTTIIIFLSALFSKLKQLRPLNETEQKIFEDTIKRNSTYRFVTVAYDQRFFKDYIIDQIKKNKKRLKTESAKRIVAAFGFFTSKLADKEEEYLTKMLNTIENAFCKTHIVKNESEAIQIFVFQNNRGVKPSNLEIVKAQFMFNVHLYGGEEKENLIEEIKDRFEEIYKSISSVRHINEDDILVSTLRVYFNSLWENNAIEKINKSLSEENPIPFIKGFTQSLSTSFEHLSAFFGADERENLEIHSLVTLGGGGISIVMPFVIKAYLFDLEQKEINLLCSKLEIIVLRHKLIGTRAEIISRLNSVYQEFTNKNPDITPINNRITWLKTTQESWWAHWGNEELKRAIQGEINHSIAKYLLWKYENYLQGQGKRGYSHIRFDSIEDPELEHIAPQTENPVAGYDNYDEEFKNQYLNCLGNYLLLSKSHNCSIGNKPFADKRESYNHLEQQREIQVMTAQNPVWTKDLIQTRKDKIIKFIIDTI